MAETDRKNKVFDIDNIRKLGALRNVVHSDKLNGFRTFFEKWPRIQSYIIIKQQNHGQWVLKKLTTIIGITVWFPSVKNTKIGPLT